MYLKKRRWVATNTQAIPGAWVLVRTEEAFPRLKRSQGEPSQVTFHYIGCSTAAESLPNDAGFTAQFGRSRCSFWGGILRKAARMAENNQAIPEAWLLVRTEEARLKRSQGEPSPVTYKSFPHHAGAVRHTLSNSHLKACNSLSLSSVFLIANLR